MATDPKPVGGLNDLEPSAFIAPVGNSIEQLCAVSQAISLKRIADALTGASENAFTQPLNDYGETIGNCIQGQLARGSRF